MEEVVPPDPADPAAGRPPSRAGARWRRFGWLFAAVWLVFLLNPLLPALDNPDHLAGRTAVVALALFAVVYLRTWIDGDRRVDAFRWATPLPPRTAWTRLVLLLALGAATLPGAGLQGAATLVFVATYALFALPLRASLPLAVLIVLGCLVLGLVVPHWGDLRTVALSTALASIAVFGVTMTARRGGQLAVAQQDLARMAVVEERGRFARDLHDLLGHSLTVVTVKAELAGRLLEAAGGAEGADPAAARSTALHRAAVEVADIERLARDALADVRAALAGYREVSLGAELAGARRALAAAGIEAELPGAVDDVPEPVRELFGWAVREGVTNVVRHSGARRCWVELDRASIAVCDDGRGPALPGGSGGSGGGDGAGARPGTGLRGLAERAAAAGARCEVGRSGAGGFSLRITTAPETR